MLAFEARRCKEKRVEDIEVVARALGGVVGLIGRGSVSIPCKTAREESIPAIELENACNESYFMR